MSSVVLKLKNLETRRGNFLLHVDEITVSQGQIACIVGPNGGGKTTLLLTVLGLLPHRGACTVAGTDYDGTDAATKAKIGFIPDDPELLFEELTAAEQWELTGSVVAAAQARAKAEKALEADLDRAEKLAEQISFTPPTKLAKHYSHGMRKKTQVVNALLGSPELIVVDELRNGLDPIAIKQTEELIKSEAGRGAAVLAATHDLWWAERFADYIYIMNGGQIIARGTLKQLLKGKEKHLEDAFFRIIGVQV